MRIWYFTDARLPGQAANTVQIMKMSAAFAAAGAETTLHVRLGPEGAGQPLYDFYAVPRTFDVRRAPRLIPGRSSSDRWNIPFSLSSLPRLIARRRDYDLLYTRLPFLALLATRAGIPVALEAHRLLPDGNAFHQWISRRLVTASRSGGFRGLVSISTELARSYAEAGSPSSKSLVAHDGVDLERFEPRLSRQEARTRLGLAPDQPIVCYCGHLYKGRGVEELLDCAARLPDVRFLFVGGTERDVDRHRSAATSRQLSNVTFTGFRPNSELPPYLFAADVLAMPYNAQTDSATFMSPMKMFEYMAAGRIIIGTDFPSVREVLEDGRNALLVPPGDAAAIASAIQRALHDRSLERLATQALTDARDHTWLNRAQRILTFLSAPANP